MFGWLSDNATNPVAAAVPTDSLDVATAWPQSVAVPGGCATSRSQLPGRSMAADHGAQEPLRITVTSIRVAKNKEGERHHRTKWAWPGNFQWSDWDSNPSFNFFVISHLIDLSSDFPSFD